MTFQYSKHFKFSRSVGSKSGRLRWLDGCLIALKWPLTSSLIQTFPKAPWRAVYKGADMIRQVGFCIRTPDPRSLNASLASARGVDSLGPGCSRSEERAPLQCAVSAVWARCHPAVCCPWPRTIAGDPLHGKRHRYGFTHIEHLISKCFLTGPALCLTHHGS